MFFPISVHHFPSEGGTVCTPVSSSCFSSSSKNFLKNPIFFSCVQRKLDTFFCSLICALIVHNAHSQKPCRASNRVNILFPACPSPRRLLQATEGTVDDRYSSRRPAGLMTRGCGRLRLDIIDERNPVGRFVRPLAPYANRSSLETFSRQSG